MSLISSPLARFDTAFAACPLIAILRGVRPDEAVPIGEALVAVGFRLIEVPLNSPDPFESIARLIARFGQDAVIGAGTVTRPSEVSELARIGASMVISPHTDLAVIGASVEAGLVSLPGCMSPSEAFAALGAGAHALKLFPMEVIGPGGVKAMRAVLPQATRLIAVGGIDTTTIPPLRAAGCAGFGIGSTLYKPGMSAAEVGERAAALLLA